MSEELTQLERSVYQYLLDFTAEHSYQPSIRDIGREFHIKSTKTVSDILRSLARKGFIERGPARSRGVRLVGFSGAAGVMPVPFYSGLRAGDPALVAEHRTGYITMDRRFLPSNNNVCFLRVEGQSMAGRGILDGDFIIVDTSRSPSANDIAAARLGDRLIVRTYSTRDHIVVLESSQPGEPSLEIRPTDDFSLIGVVCGVFRPFVIRGDHTSRQPTKTPLPPKSPFMA